MKYGPFIALLSLLILAAKAQPTVKIPKKLCGMYTGSQPSYAIEISGQVSSVFPASMIIEVTRMSISVCYQTSKLCPVVDGKVKTIRKKGKGKAKRWEIQVLSHNSLFTEDLVFNTKNKEVTRVGIFPQPSTVLKKSREK
ncbi:MAG: hypothetical protein RL365_1073 [Bacteroidota bacterium]|jgi:hypothetical protein